MSSNVTKTITCRVSNGLADSVRDEAERQGRTVNDLIVETLHRRINGSPDENNDNNRKILMNAVEISNKVIEIRAKIKELEESDDHKSFFSNRNSAVQTCINGLQRELKELISEFPIEENQEGFWSFLNL